MEKKYFIIEFENDGIRLDKYLSKQKQILSRSIAQKLIIDGNVKINDNVICKESQKIHYGDKIEIIISEMIDEPNLKPEEIPLDIVYEDYDIIIVNKPKGMVVHPGNGNTEHTLANAILAHTKNNISGIGGNFRPGIVHRLDKDTTGLLIIAKNNKSHINLANQIKNHQVTKIYTTLVKGNFPQDSATIDMPIERDTNDRIKMTVSKTGRQAVTHVKVIKRYEKYTLLRVKIDTGRTHQIRVHLSKIGFPVVGDYIYSNGKNDFGIKGQLLHSTILEFEHPQTKEKMHFECELPMEFKNILKILDNN